VLLLLGVGFRRREHTCEQSLCFAIQSQSQSLHVHFVDGGAGGYTSSATQMKAMALSRPS
jgi:hypothetical protein